MPWIPRGLREGIVTTRYPRRSDGYGAGFRGTVTVHPGREGDHALETVIEACPTDAISLVGGQARLDRGRCILCGRCTELYPAAFQFTSDFENSAATRQKLVVPELHEDDRALEVIRRELLGRVRALRRSIFIRHIDTGSDGSEEWEVAALTNPVYDVQRLGIYFTASPKHADVLLVTGVGAAGMLGPLQHTFDVMPDPKLVIAAGVDAISGGLVGEGYVARGGIAGVVPVDVLIPGSPPSPFSLLHGILLAVGLLPHWRTTQMKEDSETPIGRPFSEDPPREAGQ